MVLVVGIGKEQVTKLCEFASSQCGETIVIANCLHSEQYAVSGPKKACETVEQVAKTYFKAKMTVKLNVAGAFHTDFMASAVPSLKKALDEVEIKKPRIPVISNVDAKPHSDPAVIKKILATQVTSPVLWEDTMVSILGGDFEKAVELGPGQVASRIMKRLSKAA